MMNASKASAHPTSPPSGRSMDQLRQAFAEDGYLTFPGVVDGHKLTELTERIRHQFATAQAMGRLFSGGGTVHGHLNCFPGAISRFVYAALAERGVLDVVRALSPTALRLPNVGCNFNLPGSLAQNEHVDGDPAEPFFVVNVAAVDTALANGAIEILPGTHRAHYKYWQLLLERPKRRRLVMKQGDALIRISTLWHRGMPNFSEEGRPMLAFSWENGGSLMPDPYAVHRGQIAFLPNRHRTDWMGRLRERAFVTAPALGTAFLFVKSLMDRTPNAVRERDYESR